MHIISRYFQRADARSAWSTPAENVGTAPRPGRPAAGTKLRAEPIRIPGVGVRSAEPGGIGSCQGSGRSRSGNENNLPAPLPFPPPVFFKAEHPAVELRGISVWLCFVSCDTSFFHMDLSFARSFILSPRFFICRAIFPAKQPKRSQGKSTYCVNIAP